MRRICIGLSLLLAACASRNEVVNADPSGRIGDLEAGLRVLRERRADLLVPSAFAYSADSLARAKH